ncbi:hypothetical protein IT575_03205 [bacterium]|nr:hypothetical protein [bacterium]
MRLTQRILNLDRRIIYLAIFLCVLIPTVIPIGFDVQVTPEVQRGYDLIEGLREGDAVLISVDFGPSAIPENYPVLVSVLHQCFRKKLRPILVSLIPDGRGMATKGLDEVLHAVGADGKELYPGLQSGVDYSFLGYKSGNNAVIVGVGQSFTSTFPTDSEGKSTTGQPLFKQVRSLKDVKVLVNTASVGMPEVWLPYGAQKFGIPMVVSCTAVSTVQYYPFYNAGQFTGLLGGMKGAAEYEKLVGLAEITGRPGKATAGMDAQAVSHVFIVFAIVLANVCFFIERRRGTAAKGGA